MNVEREVSKDAGRYIALAQVGCEDCSGIGTQDSGTVCHCVWRKVFRVVLARFRYASAGHHIAPIVPADFFVTGGGEKNGYRMMNEEFTADVWLTCKRVLSQDDFKLVRFHHFLGADAKLCAPRLGCSVPDFLARARALEAKLGQVFATLEPYPLFPLQHYFGVRRSGPPRRPCRVPEKWHAGGPLRPPMIGEHCEPRQSKR